MCCRHWNSALAGRKTPVTCNGIRNGNAPQPHGWGRVGNNGSGDVNRPCFLPRPAHSLIIAPGLNSFASRRGLFRAAWRNSAIASLTIKAGESEVLNVLGMPLWFLCDAKDTQGAWSLMEEDIPAGHGPPPHRHDWGEAYYVVKGALDFEIDGSLEASLTCRAIQCTPSKERPPLRLECLFLQCPLTLLRSSRT